MRDLQKDLEICNKATPGPWLPGHLPDIEQDCEICKINAFYNKNVNREFVAQAREGWPYAIERAIKAETEVERLIKINQECEQEAHIQDEILRRYKAENAKLRAVVEAARGLFLGEGEHLCSEFEDAIDRLEQALTELDKEES